MIYCPKCGEIDWYAMGYQSSHAPHRCAPIWKVSLEEDYPEYHKEIYALSAEEAAEKYAKEWDSGDYTIVNGDNITVIVEDAYGKVHEFEISAYTDIIYTATEVKL